MGLLMSSKVKFIAGIKKILILTLLLPGCSTPISQNDWYYCESVCIATEEACRDFYNGLRCRCVTGELIEVGELPNDFSLD